MAEKKDKDIKENIKDKKKVKGNKKKKGGFMKPFVVTLNVFLLIILAIFAYGYFDLRYNLSGRSITVWEEIKEEIENLLNNDQNHLTDEEKETLEEEKNKVEELLERIEEAKEAIEEVKENNPVETITKDNVTKEDQTTLEDAQAGYVEALGVFDGNFSLSELFNINNAISIINSALDVLDQVAEFEAMIARLPNPEDVDYSARTDIKAAQLAYNELSDYAKTLVGPSLMSKYKAVLSAYKAFLSGSPLLTAFETLDVFWWAISTFFIVGVFIIIAKRTHKRYSDIENDDDF